MDPQATWDQLLAAFVDGDRDRIDELATALIDWLDRGGFPPKVLENSELGEIGNRVLARAGCLFALEVFQDEGRIE